jgi:hypothetical protein
MLNKTSRLALVIVILASSLASFISVRSFEDFAIGVDWDAVVHAGGSVPGLSDAEFAAEVEDIAADSDVTLTHYVPDRENPTAGGTYFQTTNLNHHERWVETGRYPAFTRGLALSVKPISEIGDNYRRGYYFVSGDGAKSHDVAARFDALGMEADALDVVMWRKVLERASDAPTDSLLRLAFFLIIALTVAGALLAARLNAVRELHGRSFGESIVNDFASGLRSLVAFGAVYLVAIAGFLGWYNHLHWFGTFLTVQLWFAAVFLACFAFFHTAAVAAVRRMDILSRLKGELRSRFVHLLMYAARLAAIPIAIGAIALVVHQERLVDAKVSDQSVWASTSGNVQLGLASQPSEDAQRAAETALGSWVEEQERAGEVVFVDRLPIQGFDPEGKAGVDPTREFLTVNSTYLTERPVLDASGRAVQPRGAEVLLLVPDDLAADVDELHAIAQRQVDSELHLREAGGDEARAPLERPTVRVVRTEPGQRLFTYLNQVSDDQDPFVTDPVVVVVPAAAPIFAPTQWSAYLSSGKVIFLDKDRTEAALAHGQVLPYVADVSEIEVTNALQAREIGLRANIYRLNLLAVLAALVATALGFTVVHTRRHASAIFAQHIHGWSFARRHWRLLAIDAALLAAVALQWIAQTRSAGYDPMQPVFAPEPPAWIPWPAIGSSVLLLWASLAILGIHLIRRRAAD